MNNVNIRHQFIDSTEHNPKSKRLTLGIFSKDCQYLAICRNHKSKNVEIWDTMTFQLLKTLEGHKQNVTSVAFSMDGKYLATMSESDETLRIWDMASFEVLKVHKMHDYGPDDMPFRCLMFSPNNNILAIMCKNRICFLDWQTKTVVKEIFSDGLWTKFDFVGNNHFVFFDCETHHLHIIDTNTFQDIYRKYNPHCLQTVSTSPQYIIICWNDNTQILDAITFQEVHRERYMYMSCNGRTIISGNGKYFATRDKISNIMCIYELSTFQKITTHKMKGVLDFMFSSDENNLVILGNDGARITLN